RRRPHLVLYAPRPRNPFVSHSRHGSLRSSLLRNLFPDLFVRLLTRPRTATRRLRLLCVPSSRSSIRAALKQLQFPFRLPPDECRTCPRSASSRSARRA